MIELVFADRCTACGDCVPVCPTLVFDHGEDGKPVIARQEDCQSCFLCELYCKADALFVAPEQFPAPQDAAAVLASGQLGRYRRDSAWHEWADDPSVRSEFWRMGGLMGRGHQTMLARYEARLAERSGPC